MKSLLSFLSPKSVAATAVAIGLLTLATPSFADPLTFGSYGGSTAPAAFSNTAIQYDNTGAAAPSTSFQKGTASTYTPGYTNTIAGTSWVSYDPNTGSAGDNGGQTVYTTTYTGNLAGATGMISLLADDTVVAFLNGVQIASTAPSVFDTLMTFNIANGAYQSGLNTFKFVVTNVNGQTQSGGPTGFDFKATAVTPEPSSIVMLGTGLLTVAGTMRRRFC